MRGRSRAIGYWRNMEKTAAAFRGEWFVGGDLVSRDEEGYVVPDSIAGEMQAAMEALKARG